jgi:O-succinylbenzoic acid--CoA ligase
MNLVLARCLDDPHQLAAELRQQARTGNLVGLALPQEHRALQQAVLGLPPLAAVGAAGGWSGQGCDRSSRTAALPGGLPPVAGARSAVMPGPPGDGASASPDPDRSAQGPLWRAAAPPHRRADDPPGSTALAELGPALVLGSGGSSGSRRWCLQPLRHLQASADACAAWLQSQGIDPGRCLHLAALPLQHVSGLMPLLRTERWGAQLIWLPPALLRQPDQLPQVCPLPRQRPVLLSLVPTQLHRLLQEPQAVAWLTRCSVIWVGGAALPGELAARARSAGLPLAPCYGATETAAMVCALPPARFLAGEAGCGAPLADVELRLEGAEQAIGVRTGRLSPGWFAEGRLQPFADADGWWRSGDAGGWLATGDQEPRRTAGVMGLHRSMGPIPVAAAARSSGSLVIHGRLDGAIHSGGETVFPEQVRQQLLALIQTAQLPVAELLLLAVPDPIWGERLVALVRPLPVDHPPDALTPDRHSLPSGPQTELLQRLADLARGLPPPLRPWRWWLCPELQTSPTGKWERQRWQTWLKQQQSSGPD